MGFERRVGDDRVLQLQAVHARHRPIDDDDGERSVVARGRAEGFERRDPGVDRRDRHAPVAQVASKYRPLRRVVVDDQCRGPGQIGVAHRQAIVAKREPPTRERES